MIEILKQFLFAFVMIPLIQSGHKFAHVTTAKLWGPMQNYDLIK